MGVSHARQCTAVSSRTGKRCRQPAMTGTELCRLHDRLGEHASGEEPRKARRRRRGAQDDNLNARTHGAYAPRLLPDEEPLYEEKRAAFTEALGGVDVFDRELVHLLSLIAVKVDMAVMKGAEHAAYGGMIKQILDLMRELKATRASRDTLTEGQNLTFADLFEALKAKFGDEAGDPLSGTDQAPSDQEPVERQCLRCGNTTKHRTELDGRWRCQNCGALREAEAEAEIVEDQSDAPNDDAKQADANTDVETATVAAPPAGQ